MIKLTRARDQKRGCSGKQFQRLIGEKQVILEALIKKNNPPEDVKNRKV